MRASALLLALALGLNGCGERAPDPAPATGQGATGASERNFAGRAYERSFVFTTLLGDSTFMVPWLTYATTRPGAVVREARGWLARSGTWDAFYAERWETPPTRTPMRVLPHKSLRLVVREGDGVDGIVFEEGPRNLELALGNELASWAGPRGEVLQLVRGSVYLAEQRVAGVVLDLARGQTAAQAWGDWAFLVSGDSLQVALVGDGEHGESSAPEYRGWGRLDFRELQWPSVSIRWGEARAFQPARRDVPVTWLVEAPEREIGGSLAVASADIRAGEGSGPILPLIAMFEVAGTLTIEGRTYPVRGLFKHERR